MKLFKQINKNIKHLLLLAIVGSFNAVPMPALGMTEGGAGSEAEQSGAEDLEVLSNSGSEEEPMEASSSSRKSKQKHHKKSTLASGGLKARKTLGKPVAEEIESGEESVSSQSESDVDEPAVKNKSKKADISNAPERKKSKYDEPVMSLDEVTGSESEEEIAPVGSLAQRQKVSKATSQPETRAKSKSVAAKETAKSSRKKIYILFDKSSGSESDVPTDRNTNTLSDSGKKKAGTSSSKTSYYTTRVSESKYKKGKPRQEESSEESSGDEMLVDRCSERSRSSKVRANNKASAGVSGLDQAEMLQMFQQMMEQQHERDKERQAQLERLISAQTGKKSKKEREGKSKKYASAFGESNNPFDELIQKISSHNDYKGFLKKSGGFVDEEGRLMTLPFELIVRSAPVGAKLNSTEFSDDLMDTLRHEISRKKSVRSRRVVNRIHDNTIFGYEDSTISVVLAMVANAYSKKESGDLYYHRIIEWFNNMKIKDGERIKWTAKRVYQELKDEEFLKKDVVFSEEANKILWNIVKETFSIANEKLASADKASSVSVLFRAIDDHQFANKALRRYKEDLGAGDVTEEDSVDVISSLKNAKAKDQAVIVQAFFSCVERTLLNSNRRHDSTDESESEDEYGESEEEKYFSEGFLDILYESVMPYKKHSRVMLEIAVLTVGEFDRAFEKKK